MNYKRLIRVIIYEGPEDVIDLYEQKAIKGTRLGGVPNFWQDEIRRLNGKVKITGKTISDGEFLDEIIKEHEEAEPKEW